MKYKKMKIYRIQRSITIDKQGRPVIYLDNFGQESLVWCGTTIKNEKAKDKPLILIFDNKTSYFYNYNITKIKTKEIKAVWKNKSQNALYQNQLYLTKEEEKLLIEKLINFTNQENPYQENLDLKLANQELQEQLEKQREEKEIQEREREELEKQLKEELEKQLKFN